MGISILSKKLSNISIFKFFPDVSREVWGVLIYHQWCQRPDLEPPVINFLTKKKLFPERQEMF